MLKPSLLFATTLLAVMSFQAQASDFKSVKTAPLAGAAMAAPAPSVAPVPAPAPVAAPERPGLLKKARIVPDTSGNTPPVVGNKLAKSDQGYSKMSAYNVVNDQNKPITQNWTRPKSWRIGYKNKNRAPINE